MEAALKVIKAIIDAVPTKAVEVGFGDYNNNGTPDVEVRLIMDSGNVIKLPALDVPVADLPALLEKAIELIPGG